MNKCFLIGNLTRDPEITTTSNGTTLCKFSIAVGRNFTNANGEKETDFFNIVAWRGIGENCGKFLSKGSKVAVSGRVEIQSYEDKDGNKRSATNINAEEVEFLSSRQGTEETVDKTEKKTETKKPTKELKPIESDDLPF